MSDYETVLQSVKDWDVSTKYNLLQALLQELYNKISDKREAKSIYNEASDCEVNEGQRGGEVARKRMTKLFAPVNFEMPFLTREECHER